MAQLYDGRGNIKHTWQAIIAHCLYALVENEQKEILNVIVCQTKTHLILYLLFRLQIVDTQLYYVSRLLFKHYDEITLWPSGSTTKREVGFCCVLGFTRGTLYHYITNFLPDCIHSTPTPSPTLTPSAAPGQSSAIWCAWNCPGLRSSFFSFFIISA